MIERRPWGDFEIARLKALAFQGYCKAEIARFLRRSPGSIESKVDKLGLDVRRYRHRQWRPLNPDPSKWTTADRICAFANVPIEVAILVVNTCIDYDLSVKLVRSNAKPLRAVKCRAAIAIKARELGYSYPIIARALNRDHTSIMHLVQTYPEKLAA